jgi:hypothetical protein
MLSKLLNLLKKPQPAVQPPEPKPEAKPAAKKARVKKPRAELTAKELATQNNEPWVGIVSVEVDPSNINAGSFELDWNDKFLVNLIKSGYKQRPDDTDQTVVDRWFQTVCRNIALEVYEQQMADPQNRYDELRRVTTRDLGGGRTEIS